MKSQYIAHIGITEYMYESEGIEMAEYKLDSSQTHYLWDVRHEPILKINSGDIVYIETAEVSSDFISIDSTTEDLERLDFDLFYPLSGRSMLKALSQVIL